MIYLIDDKKGRQESDFGWTKGKLESYSETLVPIYDVKDLQNESKAVFQEGNVVLYHESFLNNTSLSKESVLRRDRLEEFAKKTPSFSLIVFSGSKDSRMVRNNVAYLPVSIVYQNLSIFIEKMKDGVCDLNYLIFGKNPQIESELIKQLENSLKNIEQAPAVSQGWKNLFIAPDVNDIQNPIENAPIATLFSEESDEEFSDFIKENLDSELYDNVFIPVCFGQTLSDYNGLRLATHIRCTRSKNQLSRLFLYSFVGIKYLIQNEYFDILKTKNVILIDHKKSAFACALDSSLELYKLDELPKELKKIKLAAPQNYEDSHSIANEWAIFRWATALGASDNKIDKVTSNVSVILYFKYLNTIFPISEIDKIVSDDLKINHHEKPSILYIDDESERGWYEIFCTLFRKHDDITDLDYLGEELKSKSREEIIDISIEKIKSRDEYFDIVILDFRLHPDDFNEQEIKNVTGLRLLKEIKNLNPGIQVIIFSATNKIWNLLELQNAGADGFVIKESPENSIDKSFTINSIGLFCKTIEYCIERIFLKKISLLHEHCKHILELNPLGKYYPKDFRRLRSLQYQSLIINEFSASYKILTTNNENRFNHSMLIQFKILECIAEIFIPEKRGKNQIYWDGTVVNYYYLPEGKIYKPNSELMFFNHIAKKHEKMIIPNYEYNSTRNKIDCLVEERLIINEKPKIHSSIKDLVNYRNSFIHPKDRHSLDPLTSKQIVDWMQTIHDIIIAF